MNHIYFGLMCEGPTDRAAIPHFVDKALCHLRAFDEVNTSFEWNIDEKAGKSSNAEVIDAVNNGYYDILLVHRDGANDPDNIYENLMGSFPNSVPIIPVRELEAWMIVDHEAFLRATQTYVDDLSEIPANQAETTHDPKKVFKTNIEKCLGKKPNPRDGEVEVWYSKIAEEVNFEIVQNVPWFNHFINDLRNGLTNLGWPFA